jgi:hypothetical protein
VVAVVGSELRWWIMTDDDLWHGHVADEVRCIRCDELTNDVWRLYYDLGTKTLYICPDCFKEVRDRGVDTD